MRKKSFKVCAACFCRGWVRARESFQWAHRSSPVLRDKRRNSRRWHPVSDLILVVGFFCFCNSPCIQTEITTVRCQYNQVIVNSLLITTGTLLPQGILRDYYTDTTGDKNIINYNILLLRILLTTIRKLLVSISREYYRNFILVLRYCIYMVSVTDIVWVFIWSLLNSARLGHLVLTFTVQLMASKCFCVYFLLAFYESFAKSLGKYLITI